MRCTNCGEENDAGAKFCTFCGNPMETEAAEHTDAAEPVEETVPSGKETGRKNGRKTAVIAAAAAAVIGIGAFGAVKLSEKDPKDVVIQAFENIYTEDQVNPAEELFGVSKFAENAGKISRQSGFRLVLDDCSEEKIAQAASGAGIRAEGKTDLENQKYSVDLGVIFQNMDLLTMNFYYGEESLQAAVPELSSKVFTVDLSDGLSERVKESPLFGPMAESSGIDVEAIKEYMENAAEQTRENGGSDPYDIKGLMQRYKDGCQAKESFKAAMTVEKAGKASFVMDGAEVSCKGYQVHISKDSMIDFLRTSSDFFLQDEELKENYIKQLQMTTGLMALMGNQVEVPSAREMMDENYEQVQETVDEILNQMEIGLSDVEMIVYVDKKGRLAAVDGSTVIKAEADGSSVRLEFDVQLQGGAYLTQNLKAEAALSNDADADTVTINLKKSGIYDGSQKTAGLLFELQGADGESGSFSYDSMYTAGTGDCRIKAEFSSDSYGKAGIELTGIMDELVKGESMHLTIDKLQGTFHENDMNEDEYFTLSGECYYGPLKEAVKAPEGEMLDVIAADESDWQSVMMEGYMKAFGLMNKLGPIIQY